MIIVFGSIYMNLDMTVKRFPDYGEVTQSGTYTMLPGGKAANQSLASARAGVTKTALVGRVGDDGPGLRILQKLKRNGVMTSGVAKCVEFPTGIATIIHEKTGGTRKLLALGANSLINADQAPSDIFRTGNILLTQLECPLDQNAIVMKAAHDKGAKVVLNVAPATQIPMPLLSLVDFIIMDESQVSKFAQALKLKETKDVMAIMGELAKKNKLTFVTIKDDGSAMLKSHDGKGLMIKPAMPINNIDRSGAEDCFVGTFTACLHEGKSLTQALKMSATAYAMVARDKGVQEVFPYLDEITEEMKIYGEVKPF